MRTYVYNKCAHIGLGQIKQKNKHKWNEKKSLENE